MFNGTPTHNTKFRFCTIVNTTLFILLSLSILLRLGGLYNTLDSAPTFIDELMHIQSAYFYKLLFLDGNISSEEWNSFLSYDQPPISKYILGASLQIFNGKTFNTLNGLRDLHNQGTSRMIIPGLVTATKMKSASVETSARNEILLSYAKSMLTPDVGKVDTISQKDISVARHTIFFFSVLSTMLLIITSIHITRNTSTGLITGLLFITSPIVTPGFQQAFTESIWCFFVLLCMYCTLRFFGTIQHGQFQKSLIWGICTGSSLSLAMGTKLIAIYAACAVVLMGLTLMFITMRQTNKSLTQSKPQTKKILEQLTGLSTIIITALVVFIAFNPFLYHDTFKNVSKMIEHRSIIMETQALAFTTDELTAQERWDAIIREGLLVGHTFRENQEFPFKILYILMLFTGIGITIYSVYREYTRHQLGPFSIFTLWFLSASLFIGLTVKIELGRYFLPIAMCSCLLVSLGITAVGKQLMSIFCNNLLKSEK